MTTLALCASFLTCGSPSPEYRESIERLAISQGWQVEQLPELMCLIAAESGFDPDAVNINGGMYEPDYGLAQISGNWGTGFYMVGGGKLPPFNETWTGEYLLNPANNLRAALEIWQMSGFEMWHGYRARCL